MIYNYLQTHPKAIQYKGKSLPDCASSAIIFWDSVAYGRDKLCGQ